MSRLQHLIVAYSRESEGKMTFSINPYQVILTLLISVFFHSAATAQLRPMIYAEETIDVPRLDVWEDWTTEDGITSFMGESATIEMRPGGAYNIIFDPEAPIGSQGNDYGQVVGYQFENMLSVTWSMPPSIPKIRPHLTALQLEFKRIDDNKTRLRLFHTGFGDSVAWDEGIAYYQDVWPAILAKYKATAEAEHKKANEK